ncbi:GlsB/YeaQ/YmgE family stress response membrane protein [Labrys wisconsinensis]|uniref:Membrane protein YeaQ/YmgE (Transglycosylase-associated protein family) n=1 Tax=Labrys wisconsinensis TaxID=425677 RepID=A0ABU0JI04_9HYPH|nr:GlsB/YeaQ/YmgE family stress response membrane protein [Labrys wisconsinensis]MDQ0472874.1 putative membrane protein YeaQ/YmgE (transglycosylase-associated protein family) [Labrys wisconsinensis]
MHIIGIIIVGFIAGLIARFLTPGPTNPSGFILTTVLGILGAVVATWLGQAMGFYAEGEKAGFIGAVIGAVVVLLGWRFYVRNTAI